MSERAVVDAVITNTTVIGSAVDGVKSICTAGGRLYLVIISRWANDVICRAADMPPGVRHERHHR